MPENKFDKGYKRILAKKKNFLSLLKNFITDTWVSEICEENLELIDKEFILKDFKERESDIIYKMKFNGKEVIFYCLLELQSTVDYSMPFRLLIYMTELWRRYFNDFDNNERERVGFRLPAIIPVALYNGHDEWTAVKRFREYQSEYKFFGDRLVDFEYILLNVNKYDDKSLKEIGSLISSVFLIDKSQNKDRLKNNMDFIAKNFANLAYDEQIDLKDWLRDVLFKKVKENDKNLVIEAISSFEKGETERMTYAIERIFDEEKEKGIEIGIEKGIEKGIELGRMEMAKTMLLDNEPLEKIVKWTQLSLATIEKLQNNI